jgi:ABC-type branched-subunit amino acid transport system permease subunit
MSGGLKTLRAGGLGGFRNTLRAFAAEHRSMTIIGGMALVAAVLPILAIVPPLSVFQGQSVWVNGFANAGVFVLLAIGLNIVVGLAGLLDLGYAAFFAIGAYTYAYAASPYSGQHFPFLPMLLVGAFVAAMFGVLLGAPTLRLRGDYLAIVTLGFGEIVPIVFLNANQYTNGTNGIGGIYKPEVPFVEFSLLNPWPFYILMIVLVTVSMLLIYRLQESRIGRAWMAIREDELAAASNGINTVTTKLLAFALGASTAGFAGVFQASKLTSVDPGQFQSTVSFSILVMVVLGGMGNIWGVALGAFVIYTIQVVLLKQMNSFFESLNVPILSDINFVTYQFLLLGLALVFMMLFRPEGLFPSQRRRRELHSADTAAAEADAAAALAETV